MVAFRPLKWDTLELLLVAGVFERQDSEHVTWMILPPEARAPLQAVKVTSAAILFAGLDAPPPALDARLVCKPGEPLPARPTTPAASSAPPGTQFSLIAPTAPPDAPDEPAAAHAPAEPIAPASTSPVPSPPSPAPPPSPPPEFRLNAPLRLNPAVRDALASVVQTLNGPGASAAACAVAHGLFIPLHELERRGIQPALAVRALSEVRMLVHADRRRPPTVSRDFGGETTVGLIIDPRCVDGFDLAAFAVPEPAGD